MDHSVVYTHVSMCMHTCVNDPRRRIAIIKWEMEYGGSLTEEKDQYRRRMGDKRQETLRLHDKPSRNNIISYFEKYA